MQAACTLHLPQVIHRDLGETTAFWRLGIPAGLVYFPGHFPRVPVVPGVVQIHWAVSFARESFGILKPFHHLEAVKFKELMLPGMTVDLNLRFDSGRERLEYAFEDDARKFGSGRIYFADHDIQSLSRYPIVQS